VARREPDRTPITDEYLKRIGDLVDQYQQISSISSSRLSREIMGWQDFLSRFRAGDDVRISGLKKLEAEIHKRSA
jgi:hypothetical protein